MTLTSPKRCAVYCRVSTDERLAQSFNSIDAQREAGHAFIRSQTEEGWMAVPGSYDDPGYSGGNTERPALKRLMADIQAGRIDIVVVYKIDRLTRSLADFAKMVEVFDRHGVSFSAVTQQINSATSMGRLMLNVLLSFAQFEREVTSERIRDKIAASKAKGMWMGGVVPLGYRVDLRRLLVDPEEAKTVQRIFVRFAQVPSTTDLVRWLQEQGITSRRGTAFSKQALWKLLNNRIYLGEICHKDRVYSGQHEPLIDSSTWQAVQAAFEVNHNERRHATWRRRGPEFLLAGLVVTDRGERMQPSFTTKASAQHDRQHYRYYVPRSIQAYGASRAPHPIGRLAAEPLEAIVLAQIEAVLKAPHRVQAVCDAVRAADASVSEPHVVLTLMRNFAGLWASLFAAERRRITELLVESVVVAPSSVTVVWRDAGWAQLGRELRAGGVGLELLEHESSPAEEAYA